MLVKFHKFFVGVVQTVAKLADRPDGFALLKVAFTGAESAPSDADQPSASGRDNDGSGDDDV